MIGPWTDPPVWLALPIGIAFGYLLERGGLASARTIAGQLSFRDFTVLKVMLSAIVTAMLGVFWAERLGWLDLARVGIPVTDLLPQLVGAVVFGAGFAIAALCPGTACATAGAGRLDGLAVAGGLLAGTVGVMAVWPSLGAVAERAPRDAALLPADLGVPAGVVVAAITVMSLGVIRLAGRLERRPAPAGSGESKRSAWWRPSPAGAAALALGGLALAGGSPEGATGAQVGGQRGSGAAHEVIAREIAAGVDHVEPLDLAEWIRDDRPGLRVVDVRERVERGDYIIPGSERVPLASLNALRVHPDDVVVLYSDGGNHAAQAWVLLRMGGLRNLSVLHDGLAGWEDEVLSPLPARPGDAADSARFARARALSAWFGGSPRTSPEAAPAPAARTRRRNTC